MVSGEVETNVPSNFAPYYLVEYPTLPLKLITLKGPGGGSVGGVRFLANFLSDEQRQRVISELE